MTVCLADNPVVTFRILVGEFSLISYVIPTIIQHHHAISVTWGSDFTGPLSLFWLQHRFPFGAPRYSSITAAYSMALIDGTYLPALGSIKLGAT